VRRTPGSFHFVEVCARAAGEADVVSPREGTVETWTHFWRVLVVVVSACVGMTAALTEAQTSLPATQFLTLDDLERRALSANPTVAQVEAIARAVSGRQRQVSLYPNPIVGYAGENIAARDPGRSKHFIWVQQSIITAGKRGLVQRAVEQEAVHAAAEKDMQRHRVVNAVRMGFYEVLGAARLVEVRRDLARLAREAVDVSEDLFNVGQADRPDVLEVAIEAERAEIELARAENDLARAWQDLAAVIGEPDLAYTPLAGDLEAELPMVDEAAVRRQILEQSPELRIARARIEHTKASLARARADRIPNFFIRGGAGYNFERTEAGRDVGAEFRLEVGVPLPIFDRNQGTIIQAEAQQRLAEAELRRLELSLRSRLASASRTYRDARRTVERYQQSVLSSAQQSYQLYSARAREMAAAYPQVMIARRTLGQVRAEYVRALVEARHAAVLLEGFLLTGGLDAPEAIPGEPNVTIEAVPFTGTP
jgi:outer membrane protein, heavy metal efflux system